MTTNFTDIWFPFSLDSENDEHVWLSRCALFIIAPKLQ